MEFKMNAQVSIPRQSPWGFRSGAAQRGCRSVSEFPVISIASSHHPNAYLTFSRVWSPTRLDPQVVLRVCGLRSPLSTPGMACPYLVSSASWLFQQYGIVPDTPAGREQQRTAQRRLQEALHQATAHAAESGKP